MFRISVKKDFAAAHNLRGYSGNCESLHGHNFLVEAVLSGENLDECGMFVDFKVLKRELTNILDRFDHTYLNEFSPFDQINPTSENLAMYIFNALKEVFGEKMECVKVFETATSVAEYRESKKGN
jgi:6-pyruvoyltetrahydropterin/6-carboxytetrahydropterin synthase